VERHQPSAAFDGVPQPHLLLIGLRGAGKSTVGRLLAADLRRPFHDLDDLALRRLEVVSVRDVFARFGEACWRAAEADACDAFLAAPLAPAVLAMGGGSVMTERVERALARAIADGRVLVILLDLSPDEAAKRLEVDPGDRPILSGDAHTTSLMAELGALHAARIERYRSLAGIVVPSGADSPATVAQAVREAISRRA
jgi:shikimate kinase